MLAVDTRNVNWMGGWVVGWSPYIGSVTMINCMGLSIYYVILYRGAGVFPIYYNITWGGGVSRDPKFVLRNKLTVPYQFWDYLSWRLIRETLTGWVGGWSLSLCEAVFSSNSAPPFIFNQPPVACNQHFHIVNKHRQQWHQPVYNLAQRTRNFVLLVSYCEFTHFLVYFQRPE